MLFRSPFFLFQSGSCRSQATRYAISFVRPSSVDVSSVNSPVVFDFGPPPASTDYSVVSSANFVVPIICMAT